MLKVIISFLDSNAQRNLRAVNTKYQNLIKYSNFRLFFTRSADLESLSRFNRYNYPISLKFSKTIVTPEILLPFLSSITNLVSLAFSCPLESVPAWMSLTSLTNLTSLLSDAPTPPSLIKHLSSIREVNLQSTQNDPDLSTLRNLEHLFFNFNDGECGDEKLQWLSSASRLTSLIVRGYLDDESGLTKKIAEFGNLKQLTYDFCSTFESFESFILMKKLTALESLMITSTITEMDMAHLASNTRLTNLDISTSSVPKNMGLLQRLKSFTWTNTLLVVDQNVNEAFAPLTSLEKLIMICITEGGNLEWVPPSLTYLELHELGPTKRCESDHLTNLECLLLNQPATEDFFTLDLPQLTWLKVESPSVNQLNLISTIPSLKVLDCTGPSERTVDLWDSGVLRNLPNLETLHCEMLTPVENIYLPPSLTALYASVNRYESSCEFLTQVMGLKLLHLYNVQSNTWQSIAKLTNLEELCLIYAEGQDEEMQCMTALTNLKVLDVTFCESDFGDDYITATFITRLTNLQKIVHRQLSEKIKKNLIFLHTPLEELNKHMPYLYEIDK